MKLIASVTVTSQLQPNNIGRATRASLRIGCKPGSREAFILYQTAQNKTGIYYKILHNIEKLFASHLSDGKATIRFRVPAHDVIIKDADLVHLKCFMQTLIAVSKNKVNPKSVRLSNLSAKSKIIKDNTSLKILTKVDYPLLKPFPKCLTNLVINGIQMKRIEPRLLQLPNLTVLNLCDNSLKDLPDALEELHSLTTLILSKNQLGNASDGHNNWIWMRSKQFVRQLRLLDLGFNGISTFPPELTNLKALVQLRLNDNKIQTISGDIGQLVNLQYLTVANNNLSALPYCISKMNLQSIDVAGNKLCDNSLPPPPIDECPTGFCIPSLVEIAARSCVNNRLHNRYSAVAIPKRVMNYLRSAEYCACGSACFEMSRKKILYTVSLSKIAQTVISDGYYFADFVYYCCSQKCALHKYHC